MRGVKNKTENSLLLLNCVLIFIFFITLYVLRTVQNKKSKAAHDPFNKHNKNAKMYPTTIYKNYYTWMTELTC